MTSDNGRANLAIAGAFADEISRRGARHAVICPGSRSTPLALSLAAHLEPRVWIHIDERSAAFFALGMARQLGEPVALLCTSGTAAANFFPAIAEARLSRIPLIVLTADRPPELRGWGAAQTIDQVKLYGDHVKWFVEMPVPVDDEALIRQARAAAARAVETAWSDPAGPVHLNFPFREPLLPADLRPPLQMESLFAVGRNHDRAPVANLGRRGPDEAVSHEIATLVAQEPQGIIVCGPGEAPDLATAVTALGAATGYPILADPLSGIRFGAHDRANVIDAYDPFLRDMETAESFRPRVVIRIGAIPTSKPLQQCLLANPGEHHIVIDAGDARDPSHLATNHVRADAAATLAAIADRMPRAGSGVAAGWLDRWRTIDRATREAIDSVLASGEELFEGRAMAEVAALLPDGATLVAGNSMPVRDLDAFVRGDRRRIRIVSNRGANGIDGVNSSALGAAAVSDGPVVLVVGDLSFFHDLGGLFAARAFALDATIVVLNNDGGGIFSFLPQAEQLDAPTFEALFGTPTGLDVGAAARLFNASHARPLDWRALRRDVCRALNDPGLSIVEVVTDRERNVTQHRDVWAAVSRALHAVGSHGG